MRMVTLLPVVIDMVKHKLQKQSNIMDKILLYKCVSSNNGYLCIGFSFSITY
ncbi:hypothetical protein D1BOALGB6SA_7910 [Olavius sp. associated proteobacterium Delta 1]|nr:hypothetical protein D1BOALGB6SA_7910 [Olavius sp. associated proteobacterium Delta 1]